MSAQLPLLAAPDVAGSSSDQELSATHNVMFGPSQGEGDGPDVATLSAVESGAAASVSCVGTDVAPEPQPLVFRVIGTPVPQGSHKAYVVNGFARITDDNKKTKPWRVDVKHAAIDALGGRAPLEGPVLVQVRFVMPRPKGHFRTGRNAHLLRDTAPPYPAGKPDLDKLQRSLLDALTAAGVFRDDAQVVRIEAEKTYVDHRFGQVPCADVAVGRAS